MDTLEDVEQDARDGRRIMKDIQDGYGMRFLDTFAKYIVFSNRR